MQPPAGIRPPLANVRVLAPAVAVMTLVTVALAAHAPVVRLGVAATVIPAGKVSVNVLWSQTGVELILFREMLKVVVEPPKA